MPNSQATEASGFAPIAAVTEGADDCDPICGNAARRRNSSDLGRFGATGYKASCHGSAPADSRQPTLLGQYGDWGAYTASPDGSKVCFALSKPKASKTEPAGRKRDQAYVFVSVRPAENVRNEVSVIIGYQFKSTSDATAEIGTATFAMSTQDDGAWIKNVAEEARMVDAMRKGSDLTIKGTSGRGTQSPTSTR